MTHVADGLPQPLQIEKKLEVYFFKSFYLWDLEGFHKSVICGTPIFSIPSTPN